ncbi:MAG: hypothetical protein ACRCZZ_05680 [Phocaeicola sp.]
MNIIPKACIDLKNKWMAQIYLLYLYVSKTMGNFSILETPVGREENNAIIDNISSCMSIKPCRDGLMALQAYSELYPQNRLMRGLLDTVQRFEGYASDGTTFLIVLSSVLILIMNDADAKQKAEYLLYVERLKDKLFDIIDNATIGHGDNEDKYARYLDEEIYIRTGASTLLPHDLDTLCDILKSVDSSTPIEVHKPGVLPSRVSFGDKNIVVEMANGGRLQCSLSLPYETFAASDTHALVVGFPITFERASEWIHNNLPLVEKCNKYSSDTKKQDISLILISDYVDIDKNLNELLTSYRICALSCPHIGSLESANLLAKVLNTIYVESTGTIGDNSRFVKPIALTCEPHTGGMKLIRVHSDINETLPNHAALREAAFLRLRDPSLQTNSDELRKATFIFYLLANESAHIHMRFPTQLQGTLYYEKIKDVVYARNRGLFKMGFIPSIYYLIYKELVKHISEKTKTGEDLFFCYVYSYVYKAIKGGYSLEELKDSYDLAFSIKSAVERACTYASLVHRMTFMTMDGDTQTVPSFALRNEELPSFEE